MAKKAKRNKATSKFKRLQQHLTADSAAIVADMGVDDAAGDEAQQLEGEQLTPALYVLLAHHQHVAAAIDVGRV